MEIMDYREFISIENQKKMRIRLSRIMRRNRYNVTKVCRMTQLNYATIRKFINVGRSLSFKSLMRIDDYLIEHEKLLAIEPKKIRAKKIKPMEFIPKDEE